MANLLGPSNPAANGLHNNLAYPSHTLSPIARPLFDGGAPLPQAGSPGNELYAPTATAQTGAIAQPPFDGGVSAPGQSYSTMLPMQTPTVPGSSYSYAGAPNVTYSGPIANGATGMSSTAPAPMQAFGGTPNVAPTYASAASGNAAQIDPATAQQYLSQYEGALGQSLQPGFQQQQQQLEGDLASRGIQDSGAASYDMGNLLGQQAATYASNIQPMISQGFGYAQQDANTNVGNQQQMGLTNLGYQQEANMANAGYGNTASMTNANYYAQDRNANASAYNNYQNELFGQGASEQNALLAAYLGSYGPQTGVTNAMGSAMGNQGSIYGNMFNTATQGEYNALSSGAAAAAAAGAGT